MAFRQPTFASASRPVTSHEPERPAAISHPRPLRTELQESQEWILFPSRQDARTQTTSTAHTTRTAGLSRLSDFGSLAAHSQNNDDGVACEATNGSAGDDEELDSLDEGLQAFHEPGLFQRFGYSEQSGSLFPRHDGLGTFPASTPPVQEQLWHFEQYNPRKRSISGHQRRRSSVQRKLDAIENNETTMIEGERRERIEKWRLEQSRILLDEIENETRRRRPSVIGRRASTALSTPGLEQTTKDSVHNQPEGEETADRKVSGPDFDSKDDESFWQRITRRIIRDFIGVDDATLSVIFGESLPDERVSAVNPSSGKDSLKAIRLDPPRASLSVSNWESRLLDRISRELGVLVQRLSDHPAAFSTHSNPSTLDYAGMPVTVPTSSKTQAKRAVNPQPTDLSPTSFQFNPTLQDTPLVPSTSNIDSAHAALWGIEEEPTSNPQQDERDYWEKPPDLKTVFRFLHNQFTTQRRPSTTAKPSLNVATTSTPDSLRRAAIIRQHHPIVSRATATWEQRHKHGRRSSWARGRNGSSCASSIVGSARRMGLKGGSFGSSSRNYWDVGGGSVVSGGASGIGIGGLGAWGEI